MESWQYVSEFELERAQSESSGSAPMEASQRIGREALRPMGREKCPGPMEAGAGGNANRTRRTPEKANTRRTPKKGTR